MGPSVGIMRDQYRLCSIDYLIGLVASRLSVMLEVPIGSLSVAKLSARMLLAELGVLLGEGLLFAQIDLAHLPRSHLLLVFAELQGCCCSYLLEVLEAFARSRWRHHLVNMSPFRHIYCRL